VKNVLGWVVKSGLNLERIAPIGLEEKGLFPSIALHLGTLVQRGLLPLGVLIFFNIALILPLIFIDIEERSVLSGLSKLR